MSDLYIDNAKRKRIVTFWIPVCLGFCHAWASLFAIALILPSKVTGFSTDQLEAIVGGFKICGYAIAGLILLLVSDKAVEFIISKFAGDGIKSGQVIEKTTTEKTVISPPDQAVNDINMNVEGNVSVNKG